MKLLIRQTSRRELYNQSHTRKAREKPVEIATETVAPMWTHRRPSFALYLLNFPILLVASRLKQRLYFAVPI